MKILLIGFAKMKYMPYMHFYLDILDRKNNDISLYYWNRDDAEDINLSSDINTYSFDQPLDDEVGKIYKIIPFLKYRSSVLKFLKTHSFDRIIVLHSLPGVLIKSYLCKHYRNRFILDYRDSTYEQVNWFQKQIFQLVHNSYSTFISSPAFMKFMPEDASNVYISHNLLLDSLKYRNPNRNPSMPIKISFWGLIRHLEINMKLIKKVESDSHFELHYYGRELETAVQLKDYVKTNSLENIFFHGEYLPNERYSFAANTTLIHNLYDSSDSNMQLAMSNKFYDGIIFYLPQLCTKGSYMGQRVTKAGIGLECNLEDENFITEIIDYYNSLDWNAFVENCDRELDLVLNEYKASRNTIRNFSNAGEEN